MKFIEEVKKRKNSNFIFTDIQSKKTTKGFINTVKKSYNI
jgi:hypothetical protein